MAKVTWQGQGEFGPDTITQWNYTFAKGEPVEIDDPSVVVRAQDDKFFKVEEEKKPEVKPATHKAKADQGLAGQTGPLVHIPPSQQSTPGPVPKAGEPVVPEHRPAAAPKNEPKNESHKPSK